MNELQIFKNSDFGEIRTLEIDNEPWFVGKDVANILGYKNGNRDINRHVDEDDRRYYRIGTPSGKQDSTIINESGLYSLIFSSKMEKAKQFKRWVTSEVLPTIRKHGAYMTEEVLQRTIQSPDYLIGLLTNLKEEQDKVKRLETTNAMQSQQIAELKPKADYTDKILRSKSLVNTTQIAKDYGMSATQFNKILNVLKIQYKMNGQWLLYSQYQDKGYTSSETFEFTDSKGLTKTTMTTKWTQKGRLFLYEKLKVNNYLPTIERKLNERLINSKRIEKRV